MYNRYIPGHDGVYQCQTVGGATVSTSVCSEEVCTEELNSSEIAQQHRPPCRGPLEGLDIGDLLLLCIIVLLLIDCDEEDSVPLLITIAAFLFLQ